MLRSSLLEQLSSELQEQPVLSSRCGCSDRSDVADSQQHKALGTEEVCLLDGIPDDARDELDEFYESLFGTDAIATPNQSPSAQAANTTESATQPTAALVDQPIAAPEGASAPLDTQLNVQPNNVQPKDVQQNVQPISTLPAETQLPAGAIAEPVAPATPGLSTVADPTLGWHLPAPLVTPAEPEIPAALLEDELLGSWELDDAELPLSAPTMTPPTTAAPLADTLTTTPAPTDAALLGGWDAIPADPVSQSATHPEITSQAAASPAIDSQDEISSLTDLFGDAGFDSMAPAPAIADAPAQTRFSQPTSTEATSTGSSVQHPTADAASTNLADGYITDDRYDPASPDEDLLPLNEPIEALDSELWLDETTLNRLSEDLFNLEDAIDAPATLSYGSEPDTSTQPPVSDLANLADTALGEGATTTESGSPSSETPTLGDWSDSPVAFTFDDASDATASSDGIREDATVPRPTADPSIFSLESKQRAIAAEPPSAFILEGMDDLFADTPLTPPVTPIPPPVPPASESSTPFILEGIDDLFADALVRDQPAVTASPSAGEPPLTLEGLEGNGDLFASDSAVTTGALPSASPLETEPPFTLEGVDTLFDNAPIGNSILPSTAPPAIDQPLPFTLEGVDELFAAVPPVTAPPVSDVAPAMPPVADDLSAQPDAMFSFGETAAPAPSDLFSNVPGLSPHDDSAMTSASTPHPGIGNTTAPAPFALEQVGDLFIEVPSGASTLDEQGAILTTPPEPAQDASSAPLNAPFSLEQSGDFLLETLPETPSTAAPNETAQSPTVPSTSSEPSALEQAFASLMGSFDESLDAAPLAVEPTDADADDPEKKKGMN